MKILLLNANRVGIGTYHRALNFGRELARLGHETTMMTVSNERRFRLRVRHEGNGLRVIECPNWLDEALPWHGSGLIDIATRIREVWFGRYDVVYAFEYQPNVSLPALLPRMFRRFVLLSDWCDWHAGASYHFGGYRWAHAIDRRFEEYIRHRADFVTTINQTLKDRALSIGIAKDRVAIVNEGVDPNYIAPMDLRDARTRLGLPMDATIVASIRDADRSAEILCEAIARSTRPELMLLMIGSHPEPVRTYAERHGVAARVLTPGRVSDEALPLYLAAANMLALPLEDNLINRGRWPHKLGDMLAARRPVVVSRGGEFPQLLEARGCAVVVEYDAVGFQRAFDEIAAGPQRFAAVADAGRSLIETELNWTVIRGQLEAVLQQVTNA